MVENTDHELERQLRELTEQNQERAIEIAVLEEKMNTSYERLLAEIARRDNRLIYAMLGIVGLATAILGMLIAVIPSA